MKEKLYAYSCFVNCIMQMLGQNEIKMHLWTVYYCMKVKIDLHFCIETVENLNRDISVGYINSLAFSPLFVSGGA